MTQISMKGFLAMVAAAAVALGFALPRPQHAEAKPVPQVQMLDLHD